MQKLARSITVLAWVNLAIGRALSWLSLGVVLVCFAVVVLRYGFNMGHVWMQDLYVWLNAAMFTGVAGYTFLRNGHVRVDIFYRPASLRAKAWVDLFGTLVFLIPFVVVVIVWSWPYVAESWVIRESSRNAGGLEGLFIIKSFLIVFAGSIGLQGLAVAGRSILVLCGRSDLIPPALQYEGAL